MRLHFTFGLELLNSHYANDAELPWNHGKLSDGTFKLKLIRQIWVKQLKRQNVKCNCIIYIFLTNNIPKFSRSAGNFSFLHCFEVRASKQLYLDARGFGHTWFWTHVDLDARGFGRTWDPIGKDWSTCMDLNRLK